MANRKDEIKRLKSIIKIQSKVIRLLNNEFSPVIALDANLTTKLTKLTVKLTEV